jgi:N-ethylmaleimide reductase
MPGSTKTFFTFFKLKMMTTEKLLSPFHLGKIELKNRVVMAPMTRSRAIGNVPNELMAAYYGQRAGAGLIITEGVSPSPNGLGYARIPGAFSAEQTEAWKAIAAKVHAEGGRIFMQLMHTGRITHALNLPAGAKVLAPSAIRAAEKMWTDTQGMQDLPVPEAMTAEELQQTKQEYVQAAKNAVAAGFDGVELHGANGYLLEQFLSPFSNQRTDQYGGSVENRIRFIVEVAEEIVKAIGGDKLGIRVSPYGAFNDMPAYTEIDETYGNLAEALGKLGMVYIHIVDHSSMGAPAVPQSIKETIQKKFGHAIILSGGYDQQRAEADLEKGLGDLVAFGKPFINNPDLVTRFADQELLSAVLDMNTFYTPGEKGYTDYPALAEQAVTV